MIFLFCQIEFECSWFVCLFKASTSKRDVIIMVGHIKAKDEKFGGQNKSTGR